MTWERASLGAVIADLSAEGIDLDALVSADGVDLDTDTPAAGWTVAHQIAHLHWTDALTLLSCRNPAEFASARERLLAASLTDRIDAAAAEGAQVPGSELLAQWRTGRAEVLMALGDVPPGTRLEWIGPPMGAGTMASARIMETWAHGQDIADALGVDRAPTDRIRHVADLGVRTRDHGFRVHGLAAPESEFRIELTAPSGAKWVWGPDDADQAVSGPAVDFALLVTQRRHPDDLALVAVGSAAAQWLTIAQAFAGAPGPGREPLVEFSDAGSQRAISVARDSRMTVTRTCPG
ncbi:MAG: TIGR03084 family metal-binding protein [Nakamurella sp.]